MNSFDINLLDGLQNCFSRCSFVYILIQFSITLSLIITADAAEINYQKIRIGQGQMGASKVQSNKQLFSHFLLIAILTLMPFFLSSLILAYGNYKDYCLSYAGMKNAGRNEITLRYWLKIDGFLRLTMFMVVIIFGIIVKSFEGHKNTIVKIANGIFILYSVCITGWIILGAIMYWGDLQSTPIFTEVPTAENYLDYFASSPNNQVLFDVAIKNSQNYYHYHRFERDGWYIQQLIPRTDSMDNMRDYTVYQSLYKNHPGFRNGCSYGIDVYMIILVVWNFIVLPVAGFIPRLREQQSEEEDSIINIRKQDYNNLNHRHIPPTPRINENNRLFKR